MVVTLTSAQIGHVRFCIALKSLVEKRQAVWLPIKKLQLLQRYSLKQSSVFNIKSRDCKLGTKSQKISYLVYIKHLYRMFAWENEHVIQKAHQTSLKSAKKRREANYGFLHNNYVWAVSRNAVDLSRDHGSPLSAERCRVFR